MTDAEVADADVVLRRVRLRARGRSGVVGTVVAPTVEDLDYAREVFSPHGLGPDHGQVLVSWHPGPPPQATWHWPHELHEMASA